MNAFCHGCAMRFHGKCNANNDTFDKNGGYKCPEYREVKVVDVISTEEILSNRVYKVYDQKGSFITKDVAGKIIERFGDRKWTGGYTEYSATLMWIL